VHHYVPSLVSWTAIMTPPPLSREAAEDIPGIGTLHAMQSFSWCDHQGMLNSVDDSELGQYRCVPVSTAPPWLQALHGREVLCAHVLVLCHLS
jgi:hypothetical protein